MLDGADGCETEERKMIPKFFVTHDSRRMELPSTDEGGCGQERELVFVFDLPGPIGCPDRHGCICRPGQYPVEVSVWEMSMMEL